MAFHVRLSAGPALRRALQFQLGLTDLGSTSGCNPCGCCNCQPYTPPTDCCPGYQYSIAVFAPTGSCPDCGIIGPTGIPMGGMLVSPVCSAGNTCTDPCDNTYSSGVDLLVTAATGAATVSFNLSPGFVLYECPQFVCAGSNLFDFVSGPAGCDWPASITVNGV